MQVGMILDIALDYEVVQAQEGIVWLRDGYDPGTMIVVSACAANCWIEHKCLQLHWNKKGVARHREGLESRRQLTSQRAEELTTASLHRTGDKLALHSTK